MSLRRKHSVDTDSRVSAIGRKRPAPNVEKSTATPQQSSSKRRKRSAGGTQKKHSTDTDFAQGEGMASPNFGQNRLQSGFLGGGRPERSDADHATDEGDLSPAIRSPKPVTDVDSTDEDGGITLNLRNTDDKPIVISDDELSQEEGECSSTDAGDHSGHPTDPNAIQDDAGTGEQMQLDSQGDQAVNGADEVSFVIDPLPAKSQLCLKDLTPGQLECQIKYAFWHLKREQIDLNRLARCLHCLKDGHIDESCPQKTCEHCGAISGHDSSVCPQTRRCERCRQSGHTHCTGMRNTTVPCDLCSMLGHPESNCVLRHFPRALDFGTDKLELWITCCRCASKAHTVGDCPELGSAQAARWSLKSLDPNQIINLSVQKGIDKLEEDAQNRGMRPQGLRIRGRADQHAAAAAAAYEEGETDSDDLENFLSHAPVRQNPQPQPRLRVNAQLNPHLDSYRPSTNDQRYDRYAAPSGPDSYRPPRNSFYATDSFGRPRSRSPPRQGYRAARRSPSPSSESSYRPEDRPRHRRPSPPLPQRPSLSRGQAPTAPKSNFSIDLPLVKGTNSSGKSKSKGRGFSTAPSAKLPPKPPPPATVDKFNGSLLSRVESGGPSQPQRGGGRGKRSRSKR